MMGGVMLVEVVILSVMLGLTRGVSTSSMMGDEEGGERETYDD
jgi:hypothetical protein